MLITIEEFRRRVQSDCIRLVSELQELTGREGTEEASAWKISLPQLSKVFSAPSFQPLHLYFGSRGNLALEYQLPASSSWADVVLLGRHGDKNSAVIIELKNWVTAADRPGKAEGLIERQGRQDLHPSDQVRGYSEYCRRFHSEIDDKANVHGCVLFTHQPFTDAYTAAQNRRLTEMYPIFTVTDEDVKVRFPNFFKRRLSEPDEEFASRFAQGRYRQQRGFVAQIGAQILDPKSSPFELLDEQRRAFALCNAVVEERFFTPHAPVEKRVVIIKGPPGSGKSAIAARLWASFVTDERLREGDVVFTTTSQSQNSNWSFVFDQLSEEAGAAVIRKATAFTPISTAQLGRLRKKHGTDFLEQIENWRENLGVIRALGTTFSDGANDNQNLITVVDEAHALINPEHMSGRGQFGFVPSLGPQAYHIIRSSLLTIFLLDPEQSFRERENTTIDDISRWSVELGAGEPEVISLEGAQFRCAGSAEYVMWLESVLDGESAQRNRVLASAWRDGEGSQKPANVIDLRHELERAGLAVAAETAPPYRAANFSKGTRFDLRIFDNPEEMEIALRSRSNEGNSVRLLSTYSRKWKTADAAAPHRLPASMQDFCEKYVRDGEEKIWSRVWNYVPRNGSDYTAFIRAAAGSRMAEDPLSEVGCPYAVRGFDYDFVGVLWLNDLIWRNGGWTVDPRHVHESGIANLARRAAREKNSEGPITRELLDRVAKAYRILFTRPLKGVYCWVPDQETRRHLQSCI
jgi:uncharacterized protein